MSISDHTVIIIWIVYVKASTVQCSSLLKICSLETKEGVYLGPLGPIGWKDWSMTMPQWVDSATQTLYLSRHRYKYIRFMVQLEKPW